MVQVLEPGEVVDGRFSVVGALGRGASSTVYAVRDDVLGLVCALKTLSFRGPEALAAFRREFALLCGNAHPRLARALDFASSARRGEPLAYYTAELVRGPTLAEHARSPGVAPADVLRVVADALEALAWLHRAGIVHGDFKADNVLVREDGSGVLIDLGAARASTTGEAVTSLSGTPSHWAPELLDGAAPSARSDLFAVGRTLERLLGARIEARLGALVARLLSSDPAARPASVVEVLEALALDGRWRLPSAPAEPGELLGRDAEVAAFDAALGACAAGAPGPRVFAIVGPDGIGKSRLLRELVWRAQLAGRVFEASAREPTPLRSLFGRATGRAVPPGVDALLAARDEVARRSRAVLVLDDLDQLGSDERAAFDALVRAARPTDAALWLVASADALGSLGDGVAHVAPGALDEASVRRWVAPFVSATDPAAIVRATGGQPRALRDLCAALGSGAIGETEIETFAGGGDVEVLARRIGARPGPMPPERARAVAALVVLDRLGPGTASELGLRRDDLAALEGAGLARAEGVELCVARRSEGDAALSLVEPGVVREVAASVARALAAPADDETPSARSERQARRARALALAGDHAAARAALVDAGPALDWAPRAWIRAADAACATAPVAETWVAAAAAYEAAGAPARALGVLARALRARPAREVAAVAAYRAALCYDKLGKLGRAERELARARAAHEGPAPHVAALAARCALRAGRYADVVSEVEAALAAPPADDATSAALLESAGLAHGYLGDRSAALSALARAAELQTASGSPRARVRASSYHAIQAFRAGDVALAARGFGDALDVAERAGLGDLVATAALNLGTAEHQRGDWGAALRCYERGLRAAHAFGKERTVATLRFDLAKLHADIGLFDRAELDLAALAAAPSTDEIRLAARGLEAEVALARGDGARAARLLDEVCAAHRARGAKRELCEALVQRAEAASSLGDRSVARSMLDEVAALLPAVLADDLALRHAVCAAEVAVAAEALDEAFDRVRACADLSERVGRIELRARYEQLAAEVYRRRSATALAERHRSAAVEHWERIAATLPADLVEPFWRHGRRSSLRAEPSRGAPSRLDLVMKVLEINRRLGSTLDTNEILRLAMDAAIELTGAERGFVILVSPSDGRRPRLDVAVARNLDREAVGRSQLKFSHGVAKRVVETQDPVLTIDALADERFSSNTSVHAMRLRSILCVPIRAHGEVLGAVYLDNRFQRGRFSPDDADLLGAFADQIALALHNGRVMAELRLRTAALEEEQRRVAELMRSQASEIERLSTELDRERGRAEARRDFPDIVGRSAPMRAVLALVDRVCDTDVPVTITGESGTGKELVARAIHRGGVRAAGPFVAVNCAALPEPLLESELFGHVRGAFTGAVRDHAGLFVAARSGTLFLDEIGEIPASVQAKLLRVLQEREVRPVGSDATVGVPDVRIVCATNRSLRDEVARGRFRDDLYYRICVIEVALPPLRDRPDDIGLIAQAILEKMAERRGARPPRLSSGAARRLASYGWPGNVRQLENVLARACVMAEGAEIGPADLELPAPRGPVLQGKSRHAFREAESERIRAALEACAWNVCEVSRSLGIPRTTLYRKLARYGLTEPG